MSIRKMASAYAATLSGSDQAAPLSGIVWQTVPAEFATQFILKAGPTSPRTLAGSVAQAPWAASEFHSLAVRAPDRFEVISWSPLGQPRSVTPS